MTDVLAGIVEATREEVAARKALVPRGVLERAALARQPRAGLFSRAVSRSGRVNVIAECKSRSPSEGTLRDDYRPAAIARTYETAGAVAVSVLTETRFFGGSMAHLAEVRSAIALPVLRKDFLVDEYQLLEARSSGADAVLLMAAVLGGRGLARLFVEAQALGLESLVEVRDERELSSAVEAGATMVGINNRDLRTLHVDLGTGERLIASVPAGVAAVAESGIRSGEDLARLTARGFRACLVGGALMARIDQGQALAEMIHVAEDLRHHA